MSHSDTEIRFVRITDPVERLCPGWSSDEDHSVFLSVCPCGLLNDFSDNINSAFL